MNEVRQRIGFALITYAWTTALVLIAALVAPYFVTPEGTHPDPRYDDVYGLLAWDGQWYAEVAKHGYFYDPRMKSSVAFYPVFPFTARALSALTGLRVEWMLLAVSNACCCAAIVLLGEYARCVEMSDAVAKYCMVGFALFPTSFYYRMAYSESMFMTLVLLVLIGIHKQWPLFCLGLLISVVSCTRLVGLTLFFPVLVSCWGRSQSLSAFGIRAICLLLLCSTGLASYSGFQYARFGEPLAFVKTQGQWNERETPLGIIDELKIQLSLAPVRDVYDADSPLHWSRKPPKRPAMISMRFANPIYFVAMLSLTVIGVRRRWLTDSGWLASFMLLFVPCFLQGYRLGMASQARFASAAAPCYLVVGCLLNLLPAPLRYLWFLVSAAFMMVYTAMFVSWYWFY